MQAVETMRSLLGQDSPGPRYRQAAPALLLARALLLSAALLGLLLPAAAPARATEVEAVGEAAVLNNNLAGARKQALLNAQRNAVEQGVGLVLDSKTVAENFEIIKDKVLTSAQGFVTRYTVLEEGPTPDQQTFRVKIKAEVSQDLLEDRLSALRILHQAMGNKRVMVVYQSENPNAIERTHGAARTALQSIRDEFNKAGFRLFNEAATDKVYRQVERAGRVDRPVDDLIAMALDQQADLLVRFENVAGQRGPKGGLFSAAFATIRISVFETTTGRQLADSQAEGKQLLQANAGPYDWEKGLATAAEKAARQAATESVQKIADYYKQIGDEGFNYLLAFRGFNDDQKDLILDFLESTPGFSNLSEKKNTIDYLEVELFSSQDASRLRRMLRAGLKEKGIELQTQSTAGNRLVFSNLKKQE
jgi:hypothetical protein